MVNATNQILISKNTLCLYYTLAAYLSFGRGIYWCYLYQVMTYWEFFTLMKSFDLNDVTWLFDIDRDHLKSGTDLVGVCLRFRAYIHD